MSAKPASPLNSETANKWHNQIIESRTFAEFLRKLPYSDTNLALKVNADPSTIYRWRRGRNVPDIGTIIELALILDIDPPDAEILIRKSRQAFGDEKQDYVLLKKLHREPIDKLAFDAEYDCYADIIDRGFPAAMRGILAWRGLTQKEFAELCGVGAYQVSKWLSVKITPDADRIASALKLPAPISCELKKSFSK
jgi:transcriptional regulator with XRE-family HTH domain